MKADGLLAIGRFSTASRLSIKALRLYDEQGLLRPAHVDPDTARRYYSPAQLADADLIRRLRELEMPLAEIRALLAEPGPGRLERLDSHRARLSAELERRRQGLADLEALLAGPGPLEVPAVVRRERPATDLVTLPLLTDSDRIEADFAAGIGRLFAFLGARFGELAGPPLARYRGEGFDPERIELELALPVARAVPGEGEIGSAVAAAGPVAAVLHRGPYEGLGTAYAALAAWIAEAGAETAAPPEESYLVGPDRAPAAELRTEVIWPLRA